VSSTEGGVPDSYFACNWVFDPPVVVESGWTAGVDELRAWHTFTSNEWETLNIYAGVLCDDNVGNYIADGAPFQRDLSGCFGLPVDRVYFETGGGNNNAWSGTWDGPQLWGVAGNPEVPGTPTPTPTRTPTPTVTRTPASTRTPTPTLRADPERCRTWDWKPDYGGAVEIGEGWDGLIEPGDCYAVIPGMTITTPDLGAVGDLVGLDSYTLEWETFEYCVVWVHIPQVSILGLSLSLEWFLLPAIAWLLNKLAEM
jgi:hypothetical protein